MFLRPDELAAYLTAPEGALWSLEESGLKSNTLQRYAEACLRSLIPVHPTMENLRIWSTHVKDG